jgi:putative nucleotidyltransferase with HDIG domain
MPLISFRNVRLFKAPAVHPKANDPNGADEKKGPPRAVQTVVRDPYVLIIVSALLLAYLISYVPSKSLPLLKPGEIASKDVVAPATVTIDDEEATAKRRAKAEDDVLPVYTLDPNVALNAGDKIRKFFETGREALPAKGRRDFAKAQKEILDAFGVEVAAADLAALEAAGYPADLQDALLAILEKISAPGILFSKNDFVNKEPERGFIILDAAGGEKFVRVGDIADLREARERPAGEVATLDLPSRRKGLLLGLSTAFLQANLTLNKVETKMRRDTARAAVEDVTFTLKKGRVIIRKGDEATEETVKLIAAVNLGLRGQRAWLKSFLGTFLLFGLLFVTLWFYLRSLLLPKTTLKYFVMMMVTLVVSLLLSKLGLFLAGPSSASSRIFLFQDMESYTYALPFQFGVLLFAFLTTNTVALIYVILNSLMVGYLVQANFFVMIFCLIGGLAAIYGVKFYGREKRTSILKAGLFVLAPLAIFAALTLHLVKQRIILPNFLASETFMAVLGGILSAALAFVVLPIYENVFRFVTQTKLLELTNSESEALRQLALEAPGSYHHSLLVAALAEKAAEAIKIDPLLVKAGALYHDIGKVKMPEYFIENKSRKHDAHKDLTPSMSALVIVNHVKEGVEMARKAKLPQQIREIVEQHHGNSLVRYFYQKAKEKYDPEMQKIGEESYRYPGPPPQSKEAALVMLADSIEAASRSLRVHRDEHLKRVIRDIFDNYLQDGQLDDCAFSLKELRTIAQSFLATLHLIYQPRVEYPGFDFEAKKKPRRTAKPPLPPKDDDRGHQPPEGGSNQSQPV